MSIKEHEINVTNPSTGKSRKKKVIAIGSMKVMDILTNSILMAPENVILNRVKPFEPWIALTEEAEERLAAKKMIGRQLTKMKSATSVHKLDDAGADHHEDGFEGTGAKAESMVDIPEETMAKIKELLKKIPAIASFFQNRFDPMKFNIQISSQQMKSLIMETARFNASKGGLPLGLALAQARSQVDFGEPFLSKFAPEILN